MAKRMRSPIQRIGGKGYFVSKLLPLVPPHNAYIEPFAGGASMLFAKPPCQLEVINDLDRTLITFFRILRDPLKLRHLQELLTFTPYSRAEYKDAYTWRGEKDEFELIRKWFIVNRQAFGGIYGRGWSHSKTADINTSGGSMRKEARQIGGWLRAVKALPMVGERLRHVQIECIDYSTCLTDYDNLDAFFYCDPPYIPSTRTQPSSYKHEMTADGHKKLVELLLAMKAKILLSGYQHPIYNSLEDAGWKRIDFNYAQGGALAKDGKLTRRIESVWMNYEQHDLTNKSRRTK